MAAESSLTGLSSSTDPNSLLQLLSGAGALGGSIAQAGAQNNSASLAQQFASATGTLPGFNFGTGTGGLSASYQNGTPGLNYGSLQSPYNNLAGLAGSTSSSANGIGLPSNLNSSLNSAFGQASSGLAGFDPNGAANTANTAFLGAGQAAQQAGSGQQALQQQYLDQANALQQPVNQQNFDMLQNSLFGNGQLGSSSGGLQTTAFAKGLATQNAQNTLNAQQLGLQAQSQATNTAGVLGGLGQSLLSSAFGNFQNTASLSPSIQGQLTNNSLAALSGTGAVTNQGLGVYNAGLQTSLGQNQASARAGALTQGNANSANQQSPYGQLVSSLLGGYLNSSSGSSNPLSSLFGGNNSSGSSLLNSLFGGGLSSGDAATWASGAPLDNAVGSQLGSTIQPIDLGDIFGPSSAGGEAATGTSAAGSAGSTGSALGDAGGALGAAAGGADLAAGGSLAAFGSGAAADAALADAGFGLGASGAAAGAGAGSAAAAAAGADAAAAGAGSSAGAAAGGAASAAGALALPAAVLFTGLLGSLGIGPLSGAPNAQTNILNQFEQQQGTRGSLSSSGQFTPATQAGGPGALSGHSQVTSGATKIAGAGVLQLKDGRYLPQSAVGQASQLYNAAYGDPKLASAANVAAYQAFINQNAYTSSKKP